MIPTAALERKALPVYSGFIKYFPRAMLAVAELSRVGNDQHNPGAELHWDRSKSGDELDALTRHLIEAGTMDTDGVLHSTKVAWRAMANLEKELENYDRNSGKVTEEHIGNNRECELIRAGESALRGEQRVATVDRPCGEPRVREFPYTGDL